MRIGLVTLFPEIFDGLGHGIPGRAQNNGLLELKFWNPRDYTSDVHRTVDDRPYGGGPGMVMMAEPLVRAIGDAREALPDSKVIYLSPQGRRFDQAGALSLSQRDSLIMVSGRYEGVDERVLEAQIDEEWSIGDYVLSGGELPAMVMIDAITRLLPGALGHEQSAEQDSYVDGLLDYPHYTRPDRVDDAEVPSVLLSGDHQAIARWRLQQALGRTWLRRPDLLETRELNETERELLEEFIRTHLGGSATT
ncbi:MAG: tRNA (guanosine(37)-N1)-methyltransferase TrmD [bacterium]